MKDMKRPFIIIVIWLLTIISANAQSGLSVNQVFEGQVVPKSQMVETRVKGKTLSKYQLSYFRSVRFLATDEKVQQVQQLVDSDRRKVADENWQQQSSGSKTTIMVQLPLEKGCNRFLCYKQHGQEVTLVYMEGTLSSLDKLKELLQ